MNAGMGDARKRWTELIRAVEAGEQVVLTRYGKPIAQLVAPPEQRRKAVFGGMKGRIKFYPGWDDPIDEDRFLAGDL